MLLSHFHRRDVAERDASSRVGRSAPAWPTLGSSGKWMFPRDTAAPQSCGSADAPVSQGAGPDRAHLGHGQDVLRLRGLRERAILALMAYRGLRRGEVATLDVGELPLIFGLRRVRMARAGAGKATGTS